jgi:hypothetical protein
VLDDAVKNENSTFERYVIMGEKLIIVIMISLYLK